MDAFLCELDYLCYCRERGIIDSDAFDYFEYILNRTIGNYQVRSYCWDMYHFAQEKKQECPFEHLIHYMKKKLDAEELADFESKDSKKYINLLNK